MNELLKLDWKLVGHQNKNTKTRAPSSFFGNALIICALLSAAFVQPILSSLGSSATFFVAHNASGKHVVLFTIIIAFVIPLVLVMTTYLLKLAFGKRHAGLIGFIFFTLGLLLGLTVFRDVFPQNPDLTIISSLAFSLVLSLAIKKLSIFRSALYFASIAVIVVPFVFLSFSQVSQLVWDKNIDQKIEQKLGRNFKSDVPVVFIVFDEFNPIGLLDGDGKIDSVRFPGFHKLAQKSTWYPNASAMHVQSFKAVPSLFSGLEPAKDDPLPSSIAYPKNIFTLLGDAFNFNVIESFTDLCPEKYCTNNVSDKKFNEAEFISDIIIITQHIYYPRKWAKEKLPPLDSGWKNFNIESSSYNEGKKDSDESLIEHHEKKLSNKDQFKNFETFIKNIDGDKSGLNLIHTVLPHTPWVYLPDGRHYQYNDIGNKWQSQAKADEAYHRYLLQLGAMDKLMIKLIEKLEKVNIFDEAIIVVTADHGLVFREGVTKRGFNPETAPLSIRSTALRIPLFIKYPEQKISKVDRRFVQNIDVLPTLIEVLSNKPESDDFDGQSLISAGYIERDKIKFTINKQERVYGKDDILDGISVLDRVKKFGQKAPLNRLKPMGKYSDLYSKTLRYLNRKSKPSQLAPKLELSIEDFSDVDLNSKFLPAFIDAEIILEKPSNNKFHVAIVLNGEVAAIVPTTGKDRSRNVRAILPSALFKHGKNKLDAFLISENRTKKKSILSIEISDNEYELKGGSIKKKNLNVSYKIDKTKKNGDVWVSIKKDGRTHVDGWSADSKAGSCAEKILFFYDSKFLGLTHPGRRSLDLVEVYNKKSLANCRFKFVTNDDLSLNFDKIQAFGIFENGKSIELRLKYEDNYGEKLKKKNQ